MVSTPPTLGAKNGNKSAASLRILPKKADAAKNPRLWRTYFSSEVVERIIPQSVVRKEKTAGSQTRVGGFEFPSHVIVGVQTVVDEDIDVPELCKQAGKDLAGIA